MITVFKAACPIRNRPTRSDLLSLSGLRFVRSRVLLTEALDSFGLAPSALRVPVLARHLLPQAESVKRINLSPDHTSGFINCCGLIRETGRLRIGEPVDDEETWALYGDVFFVRGAKVLQIRHFSSSDLLLGLGVIGGGMIYCWIDNFSPTRVFSAEMNERPLPPGGVTPQILWDRFTSLLENEFQGIALVRIVSGGKSRAVTVREWGEPGIFHGSDLSGAGSIIGIQTSEFDRDDDEFRLLEVSKRESILKEGRPLLGVRWGEGGLSTVRFSPLEGRDDFSAVWRDCRRGRAGMPAVFSEFRVG